MQDTKNWPGKGCKKRSTYCICESSWFFVLLPLVLPIVSTCPAYGMLLQLYLCGDWPAARQALELCLTSRTSVAGQHIEDGPSRTLLDVMAGHNYQAPPGWNGVRELTEK